MNRKLLTFDTKAAYNAGISKEYIDIGKEFVDMQNVIIIIKEGNKSNKIDSNKVKKFEKFFESIAEGNNQSQESGDVCVSQSNPHPCPPWNNSGIYRDSRTAIINYLLSIGFQIAWYASYNNNDFTKGCDAYGCSSPIFRTQSIIFQANGLWSYRTQTPEPNPEIFSYMASMVVFICTMVA